MKNMEREFTYVDFLKKYGKVYSLTEGNKLTASDIIDATKFSNRIIVHSKLFGIIHFKSLTHVLEHNGVYLAINPKAFRIKNPKADAIVEQRKSLKNQLSNFEFQIKNLESRKENCEWELKRLNERVGRVDELLDNEYIKEHDENHKAWINELKSLDQVK